VVRSVDQHRLSRPATPAPASLVHPDDAQIMALYKRSIVIDCLASPGSFNVPCPPPGPLNQHQLRNIRQSGMTAVNVTVSGRSFEETVKNIALWQGEVEAHPELLLVRDNAGLTKAKENGRLGLILGFQDGEIIGRDLSLLDAFYGLGI